MANEEIVNKAEEKELIYRLAKECMALILSWGGKEPEKRVVEVAKAILEIVGQPTNSPPNII